MAYFGFGSYFAKETKGNQTPTHCHPELIQTDFSPLSLLLKVILAEEATKRSERGEREIET